ncbi:MAG: DUF3467 domain-containing protein [Bacteroidales bacterium]|nr:DUF3467 domain-containing protein [Bacteroidales bacterium]
MPEQKIDINLSEDVAQGTYANLAIITHSDNEFILDFIAMMPGVPKGNVRSRIIMTPKNAKSLLAALSDNVRKFEEQQGRIDDKSNIFPMMGDGGIA